MNKNGCLEGQGRKQAEGMRMEASVLAASALVLCCFEPYKSFTKLKM